MLGTRHPDGCRHWASGNIRNMAPVLGAGHPTGQHLTGAGSGQNEIPTDIHQTLGPGLELELSLGLNPHLDRDCTTCGSALGSVSGFRSGFGTGFF